MQLYPRKQQIAKPDHLGQSVWHKIAMWTVLRSRCCVVAKENTSEEEQTVNAVAACNKYEDGNNAVEFETNHEPVNDDGRIDDGEINMKNADFLSDAGINLDDEQAVVQYD